MVKPSDKKRIASHLIELFNLSERAACQLSGGSRTAFRYRPRTKADNTLRERLKRLATEYPRYGYLVLHGLLKAEGLVRNKKQTYRIYTEEGLQVRTKKRKKIQRPRLPLEVPSKPNQRWSMDFVSMSGKQVARFLSEMIETRGAPNSIVCDNGTKFTSKAMFFWSKETKVKLSFIQPGKPTQNAFVESLNGKFRNECLNQHWFRTMEEARYEIDLWREHYNHVRPHSSLNYLSPVELTKRAA
ncbi:DDE domain-containing protein [Pseudoalteromonas sp. CO325X]|nr:DDE domain-containing protein [Pseudoalteromonas sp. CO325X]